MAPCPLCLVSDRRSHCCDGSSVVHTLWLLHPPNQRCRLLSRLKALAKKLNSFVRAFLFLSHHRPHFHTHQGHDIEQCLSACGICYVVQCYWRCTAVSAIRGFRALEARLAEISLWPPSSPYESEGNTLFPSFFSIAAGTSTVYRASRLIRPGATE